MGILAVAASICLTIGGGTAAAPSQLLLLSPEEAARLRLHRPGTATDVRGS